jgi:hypothetical protein
MGNKEPTWRDWKIGEIAYFKWLDAGCPEGMDVDFWLEAEKEFEQKLKSGEYSCG